MGRLRLDAPSPGFDRAVAGADRSRSRSAARDEDGLASYLDHVSIVTSKSGWSVPRSRQVIPESVDDDGATSSSSVTSADSSSSEDEADLAGVVARAVDAFVVARAASRGSSRGVLFSANPRPFGVYRNPPVGLEQSSGEAHRDIPPIPRRRPTPENGRAQTSARNAVTVPQQNSCEPSSTHTNAYSEELYGRGGVLTKEEVARRAAERRIRLETEVSAARTFQPAISRRRIKYDPVVPQRSGRPQDPFQRHAGVTTAGRTASEGSADSTSRSRPAPAPDTPLDPTPGGFELRLYDRDVAKVRERERIFRTLRVDYERRKSVDDEIECTFAPKVNDPALFSLSSGPMNMTAACVRLFRRAEAERKREVEAHEYQQRKVREAEAVAKLRLGHDANAAQLRLFNDALRRQGGHFQDS
jgi:hypothetical protein